jgi:hypothetical protein
MSAYPRPEEAGGLAEAEVWTWGPALSRQLAA